MRKYIFILSIMSIMFACTDDEPKETLSKCSADDHWGVCDSENDYCYLGNCIPYGTKCEENQIMAPCSDKSQQCIQTDDGFVCELRPCSNKYPNGKCPSGEICYTNTTTKTTSCQPECSSQNLNGICSDSLKTCIGGECLDSSLLCSNANQTGVCPTEKICSSGNCVDRCSSDFPAGACETGKECMEGYCLANKCTTQNPTGNCPPEKICKTGDCFYICSTERPFGECGDINQSCINGSCQFPCSQEHINGFCEESVERCVEGVCTAPCSQFTQNGYCNDNYSCINGSCIESCSATFPNGYCETGKECFSGVCGNPCSTQNPIGLCHDENQFCSNGVCINSCSQVYPNGTCINPIEYCDGGVCKPYPCGPQNPTGGCPNAGEVCLNSVCTAECSPTTPTGYCPQATWICYLGVCYHPNQQPCSNLFPEGYCDTNYSCVSGSCLEDLCSPQYPTGRCEIQGQVCTNGICKAPEVCSDNRPLSGVQGACCRTKADCGENADWFSDCILNDNEGYYCLDVNISGGTGCSNDSQCRDPFATFGDEQRYFCNQVWHKDEDSGNLYDIRYCERASSECETVQRTKDVGQFCDSTCGDIQCKAGLHCLSGVCTKNCDTEDGIENNPNCFSVTGNNNTKQFGCYPHPFNATSFGYYTFNTEFCRNNCSSNNDCVVSGTTCSSFEMINSIGLIQLFCAQPTNPTGVGEKGFCSNPNECATNICDIAYNSCTIPCDDDLDCTYSGFKGFCHYNLGFVNDAGTHYKQFLGFCRYLDDTSTVVQSCGHKSQCPAGYDCIPKATKFDMVEGVCGILEDNTRAYNSTGGVCGDGFWFCESDLCINNFCRDYCNSTSFCNASELCVPLKIREQATNDNNEIVNKEVYAGICYPMEGSSLTPCSNSISPCSSNNELCYYNLPGTVQNSSQIEYLCMAKQPGAMIGVSCTQDSDCQSGICNPNTNVCSVACQYDVQCEGFNGCNQQALIAVYDDNPSKMVYVGLCE